jgi:hypothetical protein
MPVDDGCRFDQHHGVEDLRPDPVKPHPEQPVGGEEPRPARALPQDSQLMSQSNEFEFQRSAAAYPERKQGTDSGQKGAHAHDGMAIARETLFFSVFQSFEQAQADIIFSRHRCTSVVCLVNYDCRTQQFKHVA